MNEEKNNLEKSLIRSISSPKLSDLTDLAELGLDSFLSDSVAKDLPFVGSLIKLYEGVVGIRERLFLKKVLKFLFELKDISELEREAWCQKLASDKTEQAKEGESLILLLDRLDSMEKAEIVGRLFKAYLEDKINYTAFERISSMVDRVSLPDLRDFSTLGSHRNSLLIAHLANVGLMSVSGIDLSPQKRYQAE